MPADGNVRFIPLVSIKTARANAGMGLKVRAFIWAGLCLWMGLNYALVDASLSTHDGLCRSPLSCRLRSKKIEDGLWKCARYLTLAACASRTLGAERIHVLTAEMCRAACALLKWKVQQLASAAGLADATIRRFEASGLVRLASVEAMVQALQGAVFELISAGGKSLEGGPGVRLILLVDPEVAGLKRLSS